MKKEIEELRSITECDGAGMGMGMHHTEGLRGEFEAVINQARSLSVKYSHGYMGRERAKLAQLIGEVIAELEEIRSGS
jgi:hypothetical protein